MWGVVAPSRVLTARIGPALGVAALALFMLTGPTSTSIAPRHPGTLAAGPTAHTSRGAIEIGSGHQSATALSPSWTATGGKLHPSARSNAFMAYDAADKYVLLYGGGNSTVTKGDTWSFLGGKWTQLFPKSSPPSLCCGGMAYDPGLGGLLLFGGIGSGPNYLGQTWMFKAGNWTNLTANLTVAPSPRALLGMAYDAHDKETVLFGGVYVSSPGSLATFLGDTWAFRSGNWTNLTGSLSNAPTPRYAIGMTYDASKSRVLLFGGSSLSRADHDTWAFKSGAWHHIFTGTPGALYDAGFSYDPAKNYSILYGGQDSNGNFNGATFAFQGQTWTNLGVPGPYAREGCAMTFDGADGYVLLFGGFSALAQYVGGSYKFA